MARERGSVLIYAVVIIIMLSLISAMLLDMILGRSLLARKVASGDALRHVVHGAQAQLNACLQDASSSNCNAARLAACGFPMAIGDKTVDASAQWRNSACQVTLSVL